MNNQVMHEALNGLLADSIVIYQKLHHFHWRVKGEAFFQLHGKFEELYGHFAEIADAIAERILMIEGEPLGTLTQAVEHSVIKEIDEVPPAREMVTFLREDLQSFKDRVSQVLEQADHAGDRGTANLLDPIGDELDKTLWMLKAFLAE